MKREYIYTKQGLKKLRLKDKLYQKKRRLSNNTKHIKKEANYQYRKLNVDKILASNMINYLIRSGKLIRGKCERCGKPKAQAHHPDYKKVTEIIWLCPSHHKLEHLQNKI